MPTLEWIGKSKVVNHHQEVPFRVLERQYSFDEMGKHTEDNGSDNMIIHGDNLEALKALLPQYEGRVKCIYIDPPYNTGEEKWCYNDNVNDPRIQRWLQETLKGQPVGKEGEDLTRHDKWLCMMYPRLMLLQKLLADDGAIFISISDIEFANLRLICNEIFGASNFIATFIWRKVDSPNDNKVPITPDHEYILLYGKNPSLKKFKQLEAPGIVNAYGFVDEQGRRYRDRLVKKNGRNSLRTDRPTMYFPIIAPDGSEVYPIHDNGEEARWAMGKDGIAKHIAAGTLVWKRRNRMGKEVWEPYSREYAPQNPSRPYPTIWNDLATMRQAKAFLKSIFGVTDIFSTPKPHELIERILQMISDPDVIVLDSFAGSGTTAHAVLNMNKMDGGHRKFILVEMENYADTITAERVKHIITGYKTDSEAVLYDKEITTKNLAEGATLLEEAKAVAKEAKSAYSMVKAPQIIDGHLKVTAINKASDKVEGTGGNFSYYELGERLLLPDGNLNESIGTDKIRDYIWYTETKKPAVNQQNGNPYFLGENNHTAYYFYYEPDQICVLDYAFLSTIPEKAENYLIYADRCALSESDLLRFGITFKKIPRDIARV